METKLRTVTINPIGSGADLASFPMDEYFIELIQGYKSKIFFVGQLLSFWGYTEPTKVDVYSFDLEKFEMGELSEGTEILEKTLAAIKVLHFRNRSNREAQLKDIGKIVWLIEENLQRRDRYCPSCSSLIPLRFPDIFKFCGICKADLEVQAFMPLRFRKKKTLGATSC
ncbi:hypothetical protein KAR91_55840 [Candidatus Pacearchaeota archaeon]|nr:hypothetical protein [Candidatus Pacearchaeota archaeon]